jgi:PAS domain S-box-containing protein
VVGKTICCFPKDVCRSFPKDAFLQTLKAESYVGATLWGFDGKPIGLIAIIGRKPLRESLLAESILKLVAVRAAGEMERKQAEEAVQAAHDRLFTVLESITDAFFSLDREFRLTYVNREAEKILRKPRQELLGRNLWGLFPEAVGSPFQREYERALAENATVHFEAFYPPFDQWFGVHAYPSPAGLAVYFEDITGRKRAEVFVHAANALLGLLPEKLTRQDYMDAVVELLRHWTGCRCAGIRGVGEEGRLPYETYVGFSQEFWNQENLLILGRDACACTRIALGEPLPQDAPALTPGGSFVCRRLSEFAKRLSREDAAHYRGICIQSGFESLTLIPLRHQGQITGIIHLADETPDMLPPETVQLLESVAPLIGSVIHRLNLEESVRLARDDLELRVQERTAEVAERAEQLRALTVELTQAEHRERRRLAQILHDHLQQLLVAARLKVAMLRHSIRDDQVATTIGQLDELLTETINESRSLAVQLCPPVLYTAGLAAGLEWLARETGKKFDLAVEVEADAAAEPAAESVRVLLFHVVGELLLNVTKHAQAQRVGVRMHRCEQHVRIEVCDDGRGFDAARPVRKADRCGFGLFSVRERLAALGGRMEVVSSPGRGTQISILMPQGNAE